MCKDNSIKETNYKRELTCTIKTLRYQFPNPLPLKSVIVRNVRCIIESRMQFHVIDQLPILLGLAIYHISVVDNTHFEK